MTKGRMPSVAVPGRQIRAVEWNALRDAVLSILGDEQGHGLPLRSHLPAAAVMFRLKSSDGDYWTCRDLCPDGEETGQDIYVAKPWELRPSVTEIGAQTYSYTNDALRTATEGSVEEAQAVTPSWTVDETFLWAMRARNTGVVGPSDEPLFWLDINVAKRAWAALPE